MAGRNVLFNQPLPHCMSIAEINVDDIIGAIEELKKLPVNEDGSKFYRELLSHEDYKKKIYDLVEYDPKGYWENVANKWDETATDNLPHFDKLERLIKKYEFDSVIDLGCGNGRWAKAFKDKKYLGIDISPKLIEIARKKFPDFEFVAGKVEDHEPEEKFDLAFAYTCFEHVLPKDFDKAAKALKRVAKKAILIEPMDFRSVNYCHSHDYEKHFNILRKSKLEDGLFLLEIDLED